MKENNEILKKGLHSIAQMIYEQNLVASKSLGVDVKGEDEKPSE